MLLFYTVKGGGRLTSCVGACLWLLEEINQPFKLMELDLQKIEHKSDEFLALNPNGKIPCIDDDGFILWESVAICYYLARKYKPELLGKNLEESALIDQWIQWTAAELQPPIADIFINATKPPEQKQPLHIQYSKYRIMQQTILLDKELKNKKFIVGDKFTLADLILCSYAQIHSILHTDLSVYPNFNKWYNGVINYPSLASAKAKKLVILS